MVLDALSLLVEGLLWLGRFLVGGWRLLFSRRHRAATLHRWRGQSHSEIALEMTGVAVGLVFSVALVWVLLLAFAKRAGLVGP